MVFWEPWKKQHHQSVYWVVLDGVQRVMNLRAEHERILRFLGGSCQKYYLLL